MPQTYTKNDDLFSDLRDTPNQSKSFRVLQKITDTYNNDPYDIDTVQAAELQQPHYSRPLGPNDMNENQLRKLRLNDRNQGKMHIIIILICNELYFHEFKFHFRWI